METLITYLVMMQKMYHDLFILCTIVIYDRLKYGLKIMYILPELMLYLTMVGLGGWHLVLGPTLETYIKYD